PSRLAHSGSVPSSTVLYCSSANFVLVVARSPSPPLFPYTTLFRSCAAARDGPQTAIVALGLAALRHGLAAVVPGEVPAAAFRARSEEHTSELQSRENLVCRLLLEK